MYDNVKTEQIEQEFKVLKSLEKLMNLGIFPGGLLLDQYDVYRFFSAKSDYLVSILKERPDQTILVKGAEGIQGES